jgi:hypothetical protein
MTPIFIKQLTPAETSASRRRSAGRRDEAVMRTELQRWGSDADLFGTDESTGPVVSTVKLCNANFGRG